MIAWLKTCKIISLTLLWVVIFGTFLPSPTLAATIPYTITEGIPGLSVRARETFFVIDLTINYQTGQIIFSSNPDGTGNTVVDDAAMVWVVERPDGTSASTTFRYDSGCIRLYEKSPQNVTYLFKPGINKVQVRLYDICGVNAGSSPLYLVNTNAPEPPVTKTPLILIPGIGGSELKVAEDVNWSKDDGHGGIFSHNYTLGEKIWLNEIEALRPGSDDYFDVLRMAPNGINTEANIQLTGGLYPRLYQPEIDFFINNGYVLNENMFLFPYDWRMDVNSTKAQLHNTIQSIKNQTGAQKVDIVSHSMGGLVARNYIADTDKAQNVRKLFTLGTPYLGSAKALKTIQYGECLFGGNDTACLSIAPSEVKDVFRNMISAYELSPTQNYFNFYNGSNKAIYPVPFKNNTGELNYQQIKNMLSNAGHNIALFTPAEIFHALGNNLSSTNGVEVTVIAGSGTSTIGQIIEQTSTSLIGTKIIHRDRLDINGDGTVPLFSAAINDPSRNLSLLGDAKIYYTNQNHSALVSSGPALNLVKNILDGKTDLPTDVLLQPYSLKKFTLFSGHSPVNIHIYDQNGNHTGLTPNGDIETNIPGSSYDTLGDAKFIYVPEDGIYNVKFAATDQGSFDFKIREFSGSEQTKNILYKNIPLQLETTGETVFDSSSVEPPILEIDQDGNGESDTEVTATSLLTGDAVNDITPPSTEVNISGLEGLNNWYTSDVTITLNPQDENSGILKTEYTIDNGETIHQYTEPFTITQEGIVKLKIKSYDKAGNEEEIQELEIKIDKTAPEAKIYVDQDQQNLTVKSIDENNVTVTRSDNTNTKKKNDAIYLLTDIAGNTLKLDVRDVENNNKDKFGIFSVQYNNNPVIKLDKNHFNVTYNGKKTRLNIKEQNFAVKDDIKIRIQYNQKKNQSTIITKEAKQERIKEVKNGITILNLTTNKGELETKY